MLKQPFELFLLKTALSLPQSVLSLRLTLLSPHWFQQQLLQFERQSLQPLP